MVDEMTTLKASSTTAVEPGNVIRVFYYHDSNPYFIDHGPPLRLDASVNIHDVPFRVFRTREISENQEQRLWVE